MKNDLQKESLRQLLLAQKVQLLEKIKQERGGLSGRAQAASAQLSAAEQSHAQNMTERDTAFAMQEHDVAELEAIEEALGRIAKGTYGICEMSAKTIPVDRLEVRPYARFTVECQEIVDKEYGPNSLRRGIRSLFGLGTDEDDEDGDETEILDEMDKDVEEIEDFIEFN